MYGGYGVVISSLYLIEICVMVNNFIMNFGWVVGGFFFIVIGFLMDYYSLIVVILFLSGIYLVSLLVLIIFIGVIVLKESL